jgi:hypothetical protein
MSRRRIIEDELSDLDDSNDEQETNNSKQSKQTNMTNQTNKTGATQNTSNQESLTPEFTEKVLLYIKCDDLIREKMAEIKELKAQKKPCEEYIISYLESKDAPFVKVKNGKLIKNKSEAKGGLKADIIRESIIEGVKNENNIKEENAVNITDKIFELMESKRKKTIRINIKRTFNKN